MNTLNRDCAERVMGWEYHEHENGSCYLGGNKDPSCLWDYRARGDWSPSTDPAADYEVLVHVRENWGPQKQCAFVVELQKTRYAKARHINIPAMVADLCYESGDYSRAALAALEKV